jgi:hypothetical protein
MCKYHTNFVMKEKRETSVLFPCKDERGFGCFPLSCIAYVGSNRLNWSGVSSQICIQKNSILVIPPLQKLWRLPMIKSNLGTYPTKSVNDTCKFCDGNKSESEEFFFLNPEHPMTKTKKKGWATFGTQDRNRSRRQIKSAPPRVWSRCNLRDSEPR